jgi:hypothetical protein
MFLLLGNICLLKIVQRARIFFSPLFCDLKFFRFLSFSLFSREEETVCDNRNRRNDGGRTSRERDHIRGLDLAHHQGLAL